MILHALKLNIDIIFNRFGIKTKFLPILLYLKSIRKSYNDIKNIGAFPVCCLQWLPRFHVACWLHYRNNSRNIEGQFLFREARTLLIALNTNSFYSRIFQIFLLHEVELLNNQMCQLLCRSNKVATESPTTKLKSKQSLQMGNNIK